MLHADSLIINARAGSTRAFSKLVSLWYKRIYNFGFKYFGDHDMAMEIAQKSFITVHQSLKMLKDPGSFKPWLYRIAINHCHDEERKSRRNKVFSMFKEDGRMDEMLETQMEAPSNAPDSALHKNDLAHVVINSLSQLSEEQREVVIMKEYEGLKFKEIASILTISENTAKSRLYYALKTMKKYL